MLWLGEGEEFPCNSPRGHFVPNLLPKQQQTVAEQGLLSKPCRDSWHFSKHHIPLFSCW